MKNLCLVASYGGSGSTYLVHQLSKSTQSYEFIHTHTLPTNDKVGLPIFNNLTGHNEGPFSRGFCLPENTKIIVIYRDPEKAYKSRCSLKHYCHIWSETDKFISELGSDFQFELHESRKRFNKLWQDYKSEGKDLLELESYLDTWRDFAQLRMFDIAFVKYESLGYQSFKMASFLNIEPVDFSGFKVSERKLDKSTSEMFAYKEKWQSLADFEVFDKHHNYRMDVAETTFASFNFIVSRNLYEKYNNELLQLKLLSEDRIHIKIEDEPSTKDGIALSDAIYNILLNPNTTIRKPVTIEGDFIEEAICSLKNILRWRINHAD